MIHISKIARYKAQHLAIEAARSLKQELWVAGNIEDAWYYHTRIKPLLWVSPTVKYIGEIQGTAKYLKEAKALIQTPRWFDAFPLVVLEALACGTPVIAFSEGGIPEQIVDGKTGFLCKNVDELTEAMKNIDQINPEDCRRYAEEHFTIERMSRDYVDLYRQVINGKKW